MVGARKLVDEWRPWPLLTRSQIEESPSFKKGMSFKNEKRLRETSCKIIGEAGKTLDQGIVSIATAQVYFVRYFAFKDYQQNDHFIVAVAALFVASKTENKPRPLNQIAHACWRHWVEIWVKDQKKRIKDKPQLHWNQLGASEMNKFKEAEFYKRYTEAITRAERVLLYTTGFQFNVNTGFTALLGSNNLLVKHKEPNVQKFFRNLELQLVWNIVIDLYKSTRICLEWDPRTIGIACYELTCKHLKQEIPLVDGDCWWKYVARIANWPVNVGEPQAVKTIQDELMKLFRGKDKGGSMDSHAITDASGSQPGTPFLDGSRTPAASPLPPLPYQMVASTSGQLNGDSGNGAHPGSEPSLPRLPSSPPPLPSCPSPSLTGLELTDTHNSMQHASTAEVKQEEVGEAVHFSPSDEFNVSPPRADSSSQGHRAQQSLLGSLQSGELAPSVPAEPPKDPVLMRIRLERAKNLMKLKRGSPSGEPAAKVPDQSTEDDFDVHFEP